MQNEEHQIQKINSLNELKMVLQEYKFQKKYQTQKNIFIKVGAKWCNPCKVVSNYLQPILLNDKILQKVKFYEIDIDEAIDIYTELKRKKIKGIPSILIYKPLTNDFSDEISIIPDLCIIGADLKQLQNYFMSLLK